MSSTIENPLQPIRGPFKVPGAGDILVVSLLPDGIVAVDLYKGPTRTPQPEPVLLGSAVISSLNWAALVRDLDAVEQERT